MANKAKLATLILGAALMAGVGVTTVFANEGKCSGEKRENYGKCGGEKRENYGKCGGEKKENYGKCSGEKRENYGKCGGKKKEEKPEKCGAGKCGDNK